MGLEGRRGADGATALQSLGQTIEDNLSDRKVFPAGGRVEKDAFIVGRTEAGWAGLRTKVLQT